jgi:hypothetical protein
MRKIVVGIVIAATCALFVLNAGCSHQEQPASKDYYTGPMKGKSAGQKLPPSAGDR